MFKQSYRFMAIAAILTVVCAVARADQIQVPLTGWNQDIIAEKTAATPTAGTSAGCSGWVWYESGSPSSTQGLPSDGSLTSSFGSGLTFQLQPYAAQNAVVIGSGFPGSATVNLTTPANFTALQLLASAQGGSGITWTAQLNFSDASTTTETFSDPDWTFGGGNSAINNSGLVSRGDTWGGFYAGNLHIFEHDITLSATDQLKTLNSITLAKTSSPDAELMFFALDGNLLSVVPEPTTLLIWSLLVGMAIGVGWKRKR